MTRCSSDEPGFVESDGLRDELKRSLARIAEEERGPSGQGWRPVGSPEQSNTSAFESSLLERATRPSTSSWTTRESGRPHLFRYQRGCLLFSPRLSGSPYAASAPTSFRVMSSAELYERLTAWLRRA